MNSKKFSLLALVVVFLLTLSLPAFSQVPPAPPVKLRSPQITSFNINSNAVCTYMNTVTLNSVVQGPVNSYRASENQDFSGASWISPYRASPGFILTGGYGTKTIYFQVKGIGGVSNVINDTIIVKQRPMVPTGRSECDQNVLPPIPGSGVPVVPPDPSVEALNITISRVYDPANMDITYDILVKNLANAQGLGIELKAVSNWPPAQGRILSSKTINYNSGNVSGQNIRHTGSLSVPVYLGPGVPAGSERLQSVSIVAELKLPGGYADANPNNNKKEKHIQFLFNTITLSHSINSCMALTGDSGNWDFSLGSQVPAMAWLITRDLDLYDCAGLICDRNPAPFLGERVIRWEKQPSTADRNGTIHWACEGGGNVMQGGQPLFRFTVTIVALKADAWQ